MNSTPIGMVHIGLESKFNSLLEVLFSFSKKIFPDINYEMIAMFFRN